MNYIVKNDILYLLKYKKKIMLMYFLMIVIYIVVGLISKSSNDAQLFYDSLGLNCSLTKNVLVMMMYLFNVGIFLYISFILFTKDIKNGIDNIFLRLDKKKWLLVKIMSILLVTIIIKISVYLILTLLLLINGIHINNIVNLFIIDILYISIIQNIALALYIINSKYKYLLYSILSVMILLINYLPLNILFLIDRSGVVALMLVAVILFQSYIINSFYTNVFEGK